MIFETRRLDPGLYIVATPIGNARDITLRALDVLASAGTLVAEDTRTTRKLMEIHGIPLGGRPIRSYHDQSGAGDRARILAAIRDGQAVAYVSDAGTPLIADPGFKLVSEAVAAGLDVHAVPGASAVLAALTVGGLGTDAFHFAGFLPAARAARRRALGELVAVPGTLVFYETGRRLQESLGDVCDILGEERRAAICRELTKRFETVDRGRLGDLRAVADREIRGEFVLLVGRAERAQAAETEIDRALQEALNTMRVKDAANTVAGALGLNRREVYQRALALSRDGPGAEDEGTA